MANAVRVLVVRDYHGIRFTPTDQQLMGYLRRRINGITHAIVPDHNFDIHVLIAFNYSIDPEALFVERGYNVGERGFFFCTVDDVNAGGGGGGWVLEQPDGVETITDPDNQTIGIKETRVFQNTNWVLELFSTHPDHHQIHVMKMYRRDTPTPSTMSLNASEDEMDDIDVQLEEANIGQADDAEMNDAENGGPPQPNGGLDNGGLDNGGLDNGGLDNGGGAANNGVV